MLIFSFVDLSFVGFSIANFNILYISSLLQNFVENNLYQYILSIENRVCTFHLFTLFQIASHRMSSLNLSVLINYLCDGIDN